MGKNKMTNTVYQDEIYTNGQEFWTREFLENNSHILNRLGGFEVLEVAPRLCEDSMKDALINCNYSQLFPRYGSMILCNAMGERWETMELVNGSDYNEETEEQEEVYQWYIIDNETYNQLSEKTDEIIYLDSELDLYILAVPHCGTSWDYVGAKFVNS